MNTIQSIFIISGLVIITCEQVTPEEDSSDTAVLEQGCQERYEEITLKGDLHYDNYTDGPIALSIYEADSIRCGEDPDERIVQHPGVVIRELELASPGPFEVTVPVGWVTDEEMPKIIVIAIDERITNRQCRAGALVEIESADREDRESVELSMENGYCPVLY